MPMDEATAQKNLSRMAKVIQMTPFMKHLGMEFMEGAEGYAKLKLHYQDENSTMGKALHGGAVASLIDTTGATAAWTTAEIATPKYFGSTVGGNVNYLSGRGGGAGGGGDDGGARAGEVLGVRGGGEGNLPGGGERGGHLRRPPPTGS